jgi:hypothetical protein
MIMKAQGGNRTLVLQTTTVRSATELQAPYTNLFRFEYIKVLLFIQGILKLLKAELGFSFVFLVMGITPKFCCFHIFLKDKWFKKLVI